MWAWGPCTCSTACTLVGGRCALSGWRKGFPGGGAFRRCEGRLGSGAPPPLAACPPGRLSGSTTHVLCMRVCGCGVPELSPWLARPAGAACRGGGGGPSPWGVACQRCEGGLVSGVVPPPAARPPGRAAGVPRPVCPGCGWCGRGDPAPALQCAPLRAGVARCRDADSQRIQFEFTEFTADSFAVRIPCEFGLKFTVLRILGEFALRIRRRRQK